MKIDAKQVTEMMIAAINKTLGILLIFLPRNTSITSKNKDPMNKMDSGKKAKIFIIYFYFLLR